MGYERSTRADVCSCAPDSRHARGVRHARNGTTTKVHVARARAYAPRMKTTASLLFLGLGLVVATGTACSGSKCGADGGACTAVDADGGDTGVVTAADASLEAGAACASSSDCARGLACGYAIADGCHAAGTCVHFTPGLACVRAPVCACSGVTLDDRGCGLAEGYATQPIAHDGGC
jgi:hypothetical protein